MRIPPTKKHWRGALMFSLISAWINSRLSNREAGDFRRHRANYDVTVMAILLYKRQYCIMRFVSRQIRQLQFVDFTIFLFRQLDIWISINVVNLELVYSKCIHTYRTQISYLYCNHVVLWGERTCLRFFHLIIINGVWLIWHQEDLQEGLCWLII